MDGVPAAKPLIPNKTVEKISVAVKTRFLLILLRVKTQTWWLVVHSLAAANMFQKIHHVYKRLRSRAA